MSSSECHDFIPHAFLQSKCRQCKRTEAEHTTTGTTRDETIPETNEKTLGENGEEEEEEKELREIRLPPPPPPPPQPTPIASAAISSEPPPPPLPLAQPPQSPMPPPIPPMPKQSISSPEPAPQPLSPIAAMPSPSSRPGYPPPPRRSSAIVVGQHGILTPPRPPPPPNGYISSSGAFPARTPPAAGGYVSASGSFPARPLPPPTASHSPSPPAPYVSRSGSFPPPVPNHNHASPPPPPPIRVESSNSNEATIVSQSTPTASTTPSTLTPGGAFPPSASTSPAASPDAPRTPHRPPPPPPPAAAAPQPTAPDASASSPAPYSSFPVPPSTVPAGATPSSLHSLPSGGSSSSSSWVDPTYLPSFSDRLHHKFDLVVEQSNAGMRSVKRVRAFMQRFSSLQERYAAELQKIISIERNKLLAMPKHDQMESCYTACIGFFDGMDELSHANLRFSTDLKDMTVEQLEKWYGIGNMMVKEQKSEQERVQQVMLKVNLAVAKEREQATQAVQKLTNLRTTATSTSDEKTQPTAATSSQKKTFEKAREQAVKACESYSQTLISSNSSHHRYHSEELPAMLTQMQSLEEMRLHSLNVALKDFSRLQTMYTSTLTNVTQMIENLTTNMDASQDIIGFCNQVVKEHGPALPPVPFTYDLPLSLAELRTIQIDEPPSSLFYSTIEGVMKHQKCMETQIGSTAATVAAAAHGGGGASDSVASALDIPLIVPTLLRSIYDNGGMHTEGIFRISVVSDDLTRLRRQLESGNFELSSEDNPHVPACLLKSWFRDLLIPVLPFTTYQPCIQVGQIEPWSPSIDRSHFESIRTIMSELPSINEKILALLFGFLKHLSSPEKDYVLKTRMNLPNLSLVFSPGLVRSEKNDPMQMLQDTKYASNFVLRAVDCSPACFSLESQQFAAALLDEILAGNGTRT